MAEGGWFGRTLVVDATSGDATARDLDEASLVAVVGGGGLGALLLHRETEAGFDPLGEDAAVVFAFGPLAGTPLTTSAKLAVVAKSPLTYRINDALTSSDFALAGKRTGHDAIVVVGRAAVPSVVLVDDDRVRVVACEDFWGTSESIPDVTARLEARFPGFELAVIGVAGERLVRYAGVANGGRHAGRGGLGAILGSKRIKAIGVRGSKRIAIAHPERTVALAKDLAARSIGPGTEKYRTLGTVANLAAFNRLAALPTRGFQASSFEGAPSLGGEALHATRARGRGSCRSCTIGCEHFFEIEPGKPAVKAEYENVFALGPLCGVSDPAKVLAASRACDALGLDTISAGGTIAFAMEHAELGLFAGTRFEDDAKGLRFGDGDRVLAMLDAIAHRSGRLADLLAEGSRRAAAVLGHGAEDRAVHVKGLELPGYDPRSLQTMALGFAVNARGADHNRSGAYEADFSGKTDRFAIDVRTAPAVVAAEDRSAILDALILCKFLRGALRDLEGETGELLEAVTGRAFDAAAMKALGERIVLTKHAFNVREGWTRAEDTLPARFFAASTSGGPSVDRARLDLAVTAYYRERGLDDDGTFGGRALDFLKERDRPDH